MIGSPNHRVPTRVGVVGAGYVGLTVGAGLAHLGHDVVCGDIDLEHIATLRRGDVPLHEPGLRRLVGQGLDDGRLAFVVGAEPVAAGSEVVFLCLPTPGRLDGDVDTTSLEAAARSIGPALRPGAVVVVKSTAPVGTTESLPGWLERDDVAVVSNPEFLQEGSAVHDFLTPDRIVVGGADADAVRTVVDLYGAIDAPVVATDARSAEAIKYAANGFLATRLSLLNEIARWTDAIGADLSAVVAGVGADRRIGRHFLAPGPGWGGSCLPKDTRALTRMGSDAGVEMTVLQSALTSNADHMDHIAHAVLDGISNVARPRVAIWGTAFKAGTDDVRDSPALAVVERLQRLGCDVVAYDPVAPTPNIESGTDLYSVCRDADALVVLTAWPQFADADLDKVVGLMSTPFVYDPFGLLDERTIDIEEIVYRRLGG